MDWEILIRQVGLPGVFIIMGAVFFTKEIWPFLRERIRAGDKKMERLMADATEAREKYLESMRHRDETMAASFEQLTAHLDARDAQFMAVLERRDNRIMATLDRVINVLNSNGRHT